MTTDITELAQREKFESWAEERCALPCGYLKNRRTNTGYFSKHDYTSLWAAWKAAGAELVEALEKAQTDCNEYASSERAVAVKSVELQDEIYGLKARIAELESRTVTAPQNDYFASLVALARVSADKAMKKFPQPNYVLLKVAEEAGEVVQAGVHYAENRMEWKQVEGEIVQLLAMLIRLVTEGDQINGVTPPASCAAGIKVEAE